MNRSSTSHPPSLFRIFLQNEQIDQYFGTAEPVGQAPDKQEMHERHDDAQKKSGRPSRIPGGERYREEIQKGRLRVSKPSLMTSVSRACRR
jgi:hypothetical protein